MCDNSKDKKILSVLQEPLEFESEPFSSYERKLGMSTEQVINTIKEFIRRGIIRRFAGIVKHNRAGYTVNAICAFQIDNDTCDEAGEKLSAFPFITHCYRRTSYPDWPYNLYAMVHARSEAEFEENIKKCKSAVEFKAATVLPTVKEYKKSRYVLLTE